MSPTPGRWPNPWKCCLSRQGAGFISKTLEDQSVRVVSSSAQTGCEGRTPEDLGCPRHWSLKHFATYLDSDLYIFGGLDMTLLEDPSFEPRWDTRDDLGTTLLSTLGKERRNISKVGFCSK